MIPALAWRNIWRQPVRTALSVSGMTFTSMLMVFMLSFQLGTYETMKTSALRVFDGFGQFQPAGYADDPDISRTIPDPAALVAALQGVPAITAASPRNTGYVILANGERSFAAAIIGVEPQGERRISTLSATVREGRYLVGEDDGAVVLGDGLVRNLKLKLGDGVTMLGSGLDGSVAADVLTLVGIFHSGVPEIDRQVAQMPLARFQEAFFMEDAVNTVAITGDRLADIVAAEPELRSIAEQNGVVYRNWGELQPAVKQAITLDMSTAMLWYVALIVVVVFIILNTLYMSVLERTREFGVLLAVGMRPGQIGRMIWLELIFLSLLGNAAGIALGAVATLYFQKHGIAFSGMEDIYAQWGLPSRFFPELSALSALSGPGVMVAVIAILGFIPYRRALGLEPVSAMAHA
ncbi:MAG: ABC transporter permease [Paracoccaceae bacterium]